ncbi:MAG: hypothetical protein WCC76_16050 [Candidatus Acidiferrales bacterium]
MKMKASALVCILLLTALPAVPSTAEQPVNVTMVQLIANPQKFDGKVIRVIGFLRLEFEGNVLYLHREDYENSILGDGIWVNVTPEMKKQSDVLNMHYVILEGFFSSRDHGHMGMWSGTITQIRRADVWLSHRHPE